MMLVSVCGWSQSKFSPYTLQFLDSFKKADAIGDSIFQKRYQVRYGSNNPIDPELPVFIHLNETGNLEKLEEAGVRIGTVAGNLLTAKVPVGKLQEIAAMEMVKYIEMGTPVYRKMDKAKEDVQVDRLHLGTDLPHEFTGKGTVVGIVDMGFEYGHPNFWNGERTELRIKRVWNQTGTGESPEGYDYGAEYTTQESILQSMKDTSEDTHGTHVTGIAAGTGTGLTGEPDYSGIAPEADIVLVSLKTDGMLSGDNTAVVDGISYIYKYAESVGKPCVVNISLGSHIGPHDGTSAFDRMTDAMQGPGRLLVGAVGNEGANKFHLSQTFAGERKDSLKTFINFTYSTDQYSAIEIWGDTDMEYSFIPFIYGVTEQKVMASYEPVTISMNKTENKKYKFSVAEDYISGSISVNSEVNPVNQKPHMMVTASFFGAGAYRIGFYIVSGTDGTVHVWTDNFYSRLSNFDLPEFDDGDSRCSMGEIGGTGNRIVSVGAYVTRDHYYRYGIYYPSKEKLGDAASYSSRGPTADGRIKPDVAAPGSYIISSLSNYYEGNKIKATSVEWNDKKYDYGYMQGSSMASPLVAGVFATWLQADPELTPETVREIMARTSRTDEYTGALSGEGDNTWGYGKINAWNGLKECIRLTGVDGVAEEVPAVVTLFEEGLLRMLFTYESRNVRIQLYGVNGMNVFEHELKAVVPGEEYSVDLKGRFAGVCLVKITSDKNTILRKLIIK